MIRDFILRGMADPNVALTVCFLGICLIYLELCMPGKVIPGALGGVCLLLGLRFLMLAKTQGSLWNELNSPLAAVLMVAFGGITAVLWRIARRARRNKLGESPSLSLLERPIYPQK